MRRIFVPPERLAAGVARLDGEAFHHLIRVLRASIGDVVEVFDGEGHAWEGRISALTEDEARIELGVSRPTSRLPPITLAQGLAKGDKLDWVVQKATELGATRFVPLALERSVVRLDEEKGRARSLRWAKIADEAARQSGRSDRMEVEPPTSLALFLAQAAARGEQTAVLWEEEVELRLGAWLAQRPAQPLALIIGPEGGLSRSEVDQVIGAGGAAVGLGPRILRTETAGLAALAVVLHRAGELA